MPLHGTFNILSRLRLWWVGEWVILSGDEIRALKPRFVPAVVFNISLMMFSIVCVFRRGGGG